ncbi:MAG: MoaD/ThiS family protein [Chloroflexi bacterium]|nr:MoaD/ThiS family protein [Chloroflexota bacterium]
MAVQVRIPTPMRGLTQNQARVDVAGDTVAEVFAELDRKFPGIRQNLYDENGSLRSFINVFVNEEDIRHLEGDKTAVKAGDEIAIMPAIAGGR